MRTVFYTVYRVTNLVNGKIYTGKHKTKDLHDGYLGSGKILKQAISKYGVGSFSKQILHVCQSEEEMNRLERELVVVSEETYNLCPGGNGGFDYINNSGIVKFKGKTYSPETMAKRRKTIEEMGGQKHTEEAKQKIREANTRTNLSRGKKVSEKLKGQPKSPEHREKIRQAILAKHAGVV